MDRIAVLGNGIIGHGVAQIFAVAGHEVILIGRTMPSLMQARARIETSLAAFARHGLAAQPAEAVLGRITLSHRAGGCRFGRHGDRGRDGGFTPQAGSVRTA